MITQQNFVDLKSSVLEASFAALAIEGPKSQVLRDNIFKVMHLSGALEALWQKGNEPHPNPNFSPAGDMAQKAPEPPVLVVHNMEFWHMGELLSGYGLSKGYDIKPEGNYTMGVDTFEISLNRLEDTVFCITLSTKLQLTALFNKTINTEAILNRVFTLWSNLMVVENIAERTMGQEAFTQFVSRVTEKISRPLQVQVDGVELFILKDPAHI